MTKENLSIRLEPEMRARLDAVTEKLAERAAGVDVSRSAAIRAVVLRGLDDLERELGIKRKGK